MPRYHTGQRIVYNGIPGTIVDDYSCDCSDCCDVYGPDGMVSYEVELDDFDDGERNFYDLTEDEIILFDPPKRQKGFAKFILEKNL